MTLNQKCRVIFDDLKAGNISRLEFCQSYDALFTQIPEKDRKNLERRMDKTNGFKGRSLGKFALTIYDSTLREAQLIDAWVSMMLEKGEFTELYIENAGIDNSGLLLIGVYSTKADFVIYSKGGKILPDGQHQIEIKFCPTLKKVTYKVDNLVNYVNQNTYVLTIISDGQVGGNGNPAHDGRIEFSADKFAWVIFSPLLIQRMLDEIPHEHKFELGNKLCVQLLKKDFSKYFTIQGF